MQWSDIYVPVARMNNEFSNLIRTGDLFFRVASFTHQPISDYALHTFIKMRSTNLIELKIG